MSNYCRVSATQKVALYRETTRQRRRVSLSSHFGTKCTHRGKSRELQYCRIELSVPVGSHIQNRFIHWFDCAFRSRYACPLEFCNRQLVGNEDSVSSGPLGRPLCFAGSKSWLMCHRACHSRSRRLVCARCLITRFRNWGAAYRYSSGWLVR